MDILVCVKRVPNIEENEIEPNSEGSDIKKNDLVYSINDFDNYAVEEAIQLVEEYGGTVTVVTVGDDESEEILRREIAMGADKAILVNNESLEKTDGRGVASILKYIVEQGEYGLVMAGSQSETGAAEVGGMLAAMLDLPFASLVNTIEVSDDKSLKIGRDVEGGDQELNEIELPCVLSIQSGINEPRYVGIRGVRKAASIAIPTLFASDLTLGGKPANEYVANVKKEKYFTPVLSGYAEMLEGSDDEIVTKLIGMLKENGGIR